MKKEKNWRDYLITSEEAEQAEQAYIVFEEDSPKPKAYDLCMGIFSDLDVAIQYAKLICSKEDVFVTNYRDYTVGMYDYLYSLKAQRE